MRFRKLVYSILSSDIVVATAALLFVTFLGAAFWLLVNWSIYNKRYGIGIVEYLELLLW